MASQERNLKHQCAEYAYRCIKDVIDNHSALQKDYRSEVMSTGTKIKGSGLMQTLAFFLSKMDKQPHFKPLTLHLLKWVLDEETIDDTTLKASDVSSWDESKEETLKMFEILLKKSDIDMIHYTQRVLNVTGWLKRFADARLREE